MSPIEIDPLTGAPVVKTDFTVTEVNETVKSVTVEPTTVIDNLKKTGISKEPVLSQPMTNLINEARKKNTELNNAQLKKPELPKVQFTQTFLNSKLERIKAILRAGGMDSMQQEKSFNQIKEVLEGN